ncbi:MAG: biotin/lipoyl-binding protein [Planctomycetota bacterium]
MSSKVPQMQTGSLATTESSVRSVSSTPRPTLEQCLRLIQTLAEEPMSSRECLVMGVDAIAAFFEACFVSIQVNIGGAPVEYRSHREDKPADILQQLCSVPMLECLSSQTKQASFFVERATGTRTSVFVVPTSSETSETVGAACLVVYAENAEVAKKLLAEFETLIAALMLAANKVADRGNPESTHTVPATITTSKSVQRLDFLTQLCQGKIWDNPTQFAFHLVNGLCNQWKCLDVSFGIVRQNRIQLLAISGQESVYRRSHGCLAIEQAMTEALDAGHAILSQRESASEPVGEQLNSTLHQALRSKSGNSSCFSFPLRHNGTIVAVCTFRRDEYQPFTSEEVALLESHQDRLAEFASISDRLGQSVISRFRERAKQWTNQEFRSWPGRKLVAMTIAGAVGLYLVLPWPHFISVPCRLVSADQRTYSAPYSGKLSKVHFRSGDWVQQGSVLFEMDTEELRNQKLKLEAELKSRTQAMIRFLQSDDTAKAGEENSSITAIRNELAIIDSKLDRAVVRAQESGTLIESDLHQRVGETVAIGDRMFEFAPSFTQRVELKIPDYLGMEFRVGQNGRFATSAEPGVWRDIVLERVEMASTSENGENFIKAVGTGSQFDREARFGLSGFARISVGNQPGWWILLQQPIRYVQRKVSQL